MEEFEALTLDLLKHKFRYYQMNRPTISDYQYDMMESRWLKMGVQLGVDMDNYEFWVDFDERHPLSKQAEHEIWMEAADKVMEVHAETFRKLAEFEKEERDKST